MVEGVEAIKTPNESLYPKTFEEYLKKHGGRPDDLPHALGRRAGSA